ncbi:MAG TPA: hypothetical protein DDY98_04835 [Ruminococcaceae bacterium]|nr:hypothetical protein [Oscillospiraceae bacterium]
MLAGIWGKAWPILLAILFFGFIILSHELGHFTVARIFKVKINEFSIGMGPALFKKKGKETLYSLRLLPIGGYVKMEGEDEDSGDERAFCNKKVWQRFLIVLAGAVINILLGVLLLGILIACQNLVGTTTIHSFHEDSLLRQSELQPGDKLIEIDGHRVFSDMDISFLLARDDDSVIDLVVKRDDKKIELKQVAFTTTETEDGKKQLVYDLVILGKEKNILNVTANAFKETASVARLVWLSLLDLVTGKYGFNEISGPIGTVSYIAQAAEESTSSMNFAFLFNIMAFITINIGVFNLLPLPALDGGRLFFMVIEAVFRKPVPAKYENLVHAIGLILLLIFMAVVSFSDIYKLVKG